MSNRTSKLILRKHSVLSARYERRFTHKSDYWGGRRVMNDNNRELVHIQSVSLAFHSHEKAAKNNQEHRNRFVLKSPERCAHSKHIFKKAMMMAEKWKRSQKPAQGKMSKKNRLEGVNLLKTKQPKRRTSKWAWEVEKNEKCGNEAKWKLN